MVKNIIVYSVVSIPQHPTKTTERNSFSLKKQNRALKSLNAHMVRDSQTHPDQLISTEQNTKIEGERE